MKTIKSKRKSKSLLKKPHLLGATTRRGDSHVEELERRR